MFPEVAFCCLSARERLILELPLLLLRLSARTLIEKDVSIPPETFRKHVDCSLTHINRGLKQMSRLFLVEDIVDSLKVCRLRPSPAPAAMIERLQRGVNNHSCAKTLLKLTSKVLTRN